MTETYYFLSQNEYIAISICWFMIGVGFTSIMAAAVYLIYKLHKIRKSKQSNNNKDKESNEQP